MDELKKTIAELKRPHVGKPPETSQENGKTGENGKTENGKDEEPRPVSRRLGDLLIAHGVITPEQLNKAIAEQKRGRSRLGEVLVRLGFISEEQLVDFLSRQYGIPTASLPQSGLDPEVLSLIPGQIARKYNAIPLQRTARSVTLAVSDPTDLAPLDDVAFLTGLQVVPMIAPLSAIRRAIDQAYQSEAPPLADVLTEASEMEVVSEEEAAEAIDVSELRASAGQAPVIRLVNTILHDGIRQGVSDIHLEHSYAGLRVRFRIDGMLQEVMTAPRRLEAAIVSRIKVMANLDIAERRLPQDGRIKLRYQGREIDLRVSVLPTVLGEGIAIRILDKDALKLNLSQLGFDSWELEQFQAAIRSPNGIVLITGPTGSGKTTTLYSAIHTVNAPDVAIMTAEDPVEYNLRGINQVQIREDIGLSFASVLRSFLRHDPDVILVGEMRDLDTAQIAIRAALTGHRVFSTLHTNDCPSTVVRLVDMGIPPFLVASAVRLVLAQRLVRKVCHDCKEGYEADEESLVPYGHTPLGAGKRTLYQAKGCRTCSFTGLRGRVGLYEIMPVTEEIRNLIVEHAPTSRLREMARQQGMKTLREAGLLKVLEGITTLEEVLRVTSE